MGPEKKDYCRALGEVQPHIGLRPSSVLLPASLKVGASANFKGRSRLIVAACGFSASGKKLYCIANSACHQQDPTRPLKGFSTLSSQLSPSFFTG